MENSKGTNRLEAETPPCAKGYLRRAKEEANSEETYLVDAMAAIAKGDLRRAKEEANPEETCPSDVQAACPELSSEEADGADAASSTDAIKAAKPEEKPNFESFPDIVLLKVFQHLTILEKLKTESGSIHSHIHSHVHI